MWYGAWQPFKGQRLDGSLVDLNKWVGTITRWTLSDRIGQRVGALFQNLFGDSWSPEEEFPLTPENEEILDALLAQEGGTEH